MSKTSSSEKSTLPLGSSSGNRRTSATSLCSSFSFSNILFATVGYRGGVGGPRETWLIVNSKLNTIPHRQTNERFFCQSASRLLYTFSRQPVDVETCCYISTFVLARFSSPKQGWWSFHLHFIALLPGLNFHFAEKTFCFLNWRPSLPPPEWDALSRLVCQSESGDSEWMGEFHPPTQSLGNNRTILLLFEFSLKAVTDSLYS